MTEVGLKSKLRRELGKAVTWVHLDTVISTTTCVGWLEGSVESRAVEGDQFVETVTHALEGTAGSIDYAVRPTGFAAVNFGLANDLFWNLNHSVKNVADSPSEFTGRGVFRSWRSLDVRLDGDAKAECECDQ